MSIWEGVAALTAQLAEAERRIQAVRALCDDDDGYDSTHLVEQIRAVLDPKQAL